VLLAAVHAQLAVLSQVVASGRRKCFYIYDLAASRVEQVQGIMGRQEKSFESFVTCPSSSNPLIAFLGNEGCIPLLSLKSRQSVGTLKMNGTVRTAAFSANGQELLTAGMICCPGKICGMDAHNRVQGILCQHNIAAVHEAALSSWQGMPPTAEVMTNGHELPEKSTSPICHCRH